MNKKIYIAVLQCLLITISISIFSYCFIKYTSVNEQVKLVSDGHGTNKYIKITDNYDTRGHKSFYEFLSEDNSLDKMKAFHDSIINNFKNRYLEISDQCIYFIGDYTNNIEFVKNGNYKLVNQKIKNDFNDNIYISPLNTIQLSQESFDFLNLKDNVIMGDCFTDDEYKIEENTVSIILGNNYKKNYEIGDEIKGTFINKEFTFKVKGFLSENSVISINYSKYDLDNFIIMPLIELNYNLIDEKDLYFQKVVYSIKSTCYISYSSNENYTITKKIVDNLIKKSDLDYICIDNNLQSFTKNSAVESMKTNRILFIISIIIIIILSCTLVFMTIRILDKNLKTYGSNIQNRKILSKTKFNVFLSLIIQWIIGIGISNYFSFRYFTDTVYFSYFIKLINKQIIILIIILIFIISMSNIYIEVKSHNNKNFK